MSSICSMQAEFRISGQFIPRQGFLINTPPPFANWLVQDGTLALLPKSYSRKLAEIILVIPFCQFGAVAYGGIAKTANRVHLTECAEELLRDSSRAVRTYTSTLHCSASCPIKQATGKGSWARERSRLSDL